MLTNWVNQPLQIRDNSKSLDRALGTGSHCVSTEVLTPREKPTQSSLPHSCQVPTAVMNGVESHLSLLSLPTQCRGGEGATNIYLLLQLYYCYQSENLYILFFLVEAIKFSWKHRIFYELLHIVDRHSRGQTDSKCYDPVSLYSLQFAF